MLYGLGRRPCFLVLSTIFCAWFLSFNLVAALDFQELYRLKIENSVSGEVAVSQDQGATWQKLGQVIYPTVKISKNGYMAASWVEAGQVAATSVNAIHLKAGVSREIFSILPKEFLAPPNKYRSFLSPDSSIYTNIAAGSAIFGGSFAPLVGSWVLIQRPAEALKTLPANFVPQNSDVYYVIVEQPDQYPTEIIFENQFGGKVLATYPGLGQQVIGQVLSPLVGVGRFEGTNFAGVGRIRANHAGVIDISTSRIGQIGGFQIIPSFHTLDMPYVKRKTQWLVVGPTSVEGEGLEGRAPLFKYFIRPNYRASDLEASDWESKLLSRFLVEVKYQGGASWEPMPVLEINKFYLRRELPNWADTALERISQIKILFPLSTN